MARVRRSLLRTRRVIPTPQEEERQGDDSTEGLPLCPVSRLRHGSPDVGSSFGRAGIAGEVVVFEGTFDPVFAHAIGISGNTEGDVRGCGPVLVLAGGPEAFERQFRTSLPSGRKRSLQASCLTLLLPCFVELCDLLARKLSAIGYCSPLCS